MSLTGQTVLAILRHANSLRVVDDFVRGQGGTTIGVALDPVEAPDGVAMALDAIKAALPRAAIVVAGTKVYDDVKDGPSRLAAFLALLATGGIGAKPLCLTHLHPADGGLRAVLQAAGLRIALCDNDNLKRDGMRQLGPLILAAAEKLGI